jgi:hypothetical protein
MASRVCGNQQVKLLPSVSRCNYEASGKRLRLLLKEYRVEPADFAVFLNVCPECLAAWFVHGVPPWLLDKLSRLLSVREQWLATGEGSRTSLGNEFLSRSRL